MTRHCANAWLIADRKMLLVFNKKLQLWLPPGGGMKGDENPGKAALRELWEEVHVPQYKVQSLDFVDRVNGVGVPTIIYNAMPTTVTEVGEHECLVVHNLAFEAATTLHVEPNLEEVEAAQWFIIGDPLGAIETTQDIRFLNTWLDHHLPPRKDYEWSR